MVSVGEALWAVQQAAKAIPQYLTTRDAAAHLKLSPQRLEIWRHQGEGPPYLKIGRSVRYDRTQLDAWVQRHAVSHAVEKA